MYSPLIFALESKTLQGPLYIWFSWLVESTNVAQEHIPLILLQPNPLELPSALLECKSGGSAKANWERKLGLQGGCRWGLA